MLDFYCSARQNIEPMVKFTVRRINQSWQLGWISLLGAIELYKFIINKTLIRSGFTLNTKQI